MEDKSMPGRRIMRATEVSARVRKGRVQIWRDVKAGTFPAPVQLGPNAVGWFEDEVDAWLASRPRQTYGAPVADGEPVAAQARQQPDDAAADRTPKAGEAR